MKKNKLFLCALASGMLALTGCSDSTDFSETKGANWNADGTGYVSLAINLPQTNNGAMRANDVFDDGLTAEYAVKDAILCLFTATKDQNNPTEGDYTLAAAYKLPLNFNLSGSTTDQITSTAKITKKIKSLSDNTSSIKALVILNPEAANLSCNNPVDMENTDDNVLSITVNGADGSPSTASLNGKTFKEICNYTNQINTNLNAGNYFMMTNAPLSKVPSTSESTAPTGTGNVFTLAEVDPGKIKQTADEAAESPASVIYVERSVAKVSVVADGNISGQANTYKVVNDGENNNPLGLYCKVLDFELDNTNNTSFIVRNTNDNTQTNWTNYLESMLSLRSGSTTVQSSATGYRMVGNMPVCTNLAGTQNLYRTYFAKDVNYNYDVDAAGGIALNKEINWANKGLKDPRYCLENTFDVAHMTQKNTTRAVLKVEFFRGGKNGHVQDGDFAYMYNNDADNFYLSTEAFENHALNIVKGNSLVKLLIASLKPANEDTPIAVSKVIFHQMENAPGYIELYGFTLTGVENFTDGLTVIKGNPNVLAKNSWEALHDYFGKVAKYTNGIGYYTVLIKHFGDDLTPWNNSEYGTDNTKKPTPANIYPGVETETNDADANYLGRYGVLRNNWYEINVNGVNRVGTPSVPVAGSEWDDQLESYISVKINILSWAVRKQGVILQ